MEPKIHSLIIKPATEPIFSEQSTIVGIDGEGYEVECTSCGYDAPACIIAGKYRGEK